VIGADGKSVGSVELRWSAACQTNWARVSSGIGVQPLSVTVTRDDAKSMASNFNGNADLVADGLGRQDRQVRGHRLDREGERCRRRRAAAAGGPVQLIEALVRTMDRVLAALPVIACPPAARRPSQVPWLSVQ